MAAMLQPFVTLPWPRATLLPRSLLSTLRLLTMQVAGCTLLKFVQRLPRELRLFIYGGTHKEVDLTGAHYELIRAMTGSVTLPHLLRGRLKETWAGDQVADPEPFLQEVKMLPIKVINSGAARALKYVADKGLGIPSWINAFAFDLEAARDIFTAHVRREVRPRVDALAKNRHFFAVEAIEAIFMQLFLLEVRKRTDTPSIFFCSLLLECDLLAKKVPGRAPYSQHIIIRNWT